MLKGLTLLNNETKSPFNWNIYKMVTNGDYNVLVQIDMRVGIDKPMIIAYNAKEHIKDGETYYELLNFYYGLHM